MSINLTTPGILFKFRFFNETIHRFDRIISYKLKIKLNITYLFKFNYLIEIALNINNYYFCYLLQLIEQENLKGVVSMNETYELKLFSNDADVSLSVYNIRNNYLF